jgi:hypothetical protein
MRFDSPTTTMIHRSEEINARDLGQWKKYQGKYHSHAGTKRKQLQKRRKGNV